MADRLKIEIPYFQCANRIFEVSGLTEHELITYIYLCRCGNQGSKIFPSYADIGYKTNVSEKTAKRAIEGLLQKELVIKHNMFKKSKNGKISRSSNVYEINTNIDEYLKNHEAKECKSSIIEGDKILPLGQRDPRGRVRETQPLGQRDPIKRTTEKELFKQELLQQQHDIELQNENTENNKKNDDDVINPNLEFSEKDSTEEIEIKERIEKKIGEIQQSGFLKLLKYSDLETIAYYLDNWKKFDSVNMSSEVGFFIDACIKKYPFPKSKKGMVNNQPIQATNYEQREYDDEFFDGLYINKEYI